MFYEIEMKSHVRVPPDRFDEKNLNDSILVQLNEEFEGKITQSYGIAIAVSEVMNIGEGILIPGDGAAYYETTFKLLAFKPEIQEIILGEVTDITEFGVFFNMGSIDGMIHVSQTMDDFVTPSKTGVLTGKDSKKVLKTGDLCRARIVAVSYKEMNNPKIGLTMRQPGLGKLEWFKEEKLKKQKDAKKALKTEQKSVKGGKKK